MPAKRGPAFTIPANSTLGAQLSPEGSAPIPQHFEQNNNKQTTSPSPSIFPPLPPPIANFTPLSQSQATPSSFASSPSFIIPFSPSGSPSQLDSNLPFLSLDPTNLDSTDVTLINELSHLAEVAPSNGIFYILHINQ